jgi:ferredoxin-NADP reductase
MMKATRENLKKIGFKKGKIHTEEFSLKLWKGA